MIRSGLFEDCCVCSGKGTSGWGIDWGHKICKEQKQKGRPNSPVPGAGGWGGCISSPALPLLGLGVVTSPFWVPGSTSVKWRVLTQGWLLYASYKTSFSETLSSPPLTVFGPQTRAEWIKVIAWLWLDQSSSFLQNFGLRVRLVILTAKGMFWNATHAPEWSLFSFLIPDYSTCPWFSLSSCCHILGT